MFPSAKTLVLLVLPLQLLLLFHLLRTAHDMLDEVFDLGDALLLRKKGQEESIPLSEVKSVRYVGGIGLKGGYHLVTNYRINLNRKSTFGKNVTFSAKLEWRNDPEALLELKTRIKSTRMAGSSKQGL